MTSEHNSDTPSREVRDLIETLDRHRGFLLHTAEGLTEEQARTPSTVSALTIASLLKHVADTEEAWMLFALHGEQTSDEPDAPDTDASDPDAPGSDAHDGDVGVTVDEIRANEGDAAEGGAAEGGAAEISANAGGAAEVDGAEADAQDRDADTWDPDTWDPDTWEDTRFVLGEEDTLPVLRERVLTVGTRTAEILQTADLDSDQALPAAPWFEPGARWSVRRVAMHMLAEMSQHAGHADIIREAIDGRRTMG